MKLAARIATALAALALAAPALACDHGTKTTTASKEQKPSVAKAEKKADAKVEKKAN